MNIGSTIRRLRKAEGLTQIEFGKRVKLSQTALSQIEKGYHIPHHATLMRIAKGLGTTVGLIYLLSIEAEDLPKKTQAVHGILFPILKELVKTLSGG